MPCLKPPDLSPSFSIPTPALRWLFVGFEITWSSTVASPRCQSVMRSRSATRRWKGLEGVGEVAIGNSDLDLAERDLIQLDLLFLQGWKEGMAFNIDGIATAIWGLIADLTCQLWWGFHMALSIQTKLLGTWISRSREFLVGMGVPKG